MCWQSTASSANFLTELPFTVRYAGRVKFRKYWFLPIIAVLAGIVITAGVVYRVSQPTTPKLPQPPLKELAAKHNVKVGNFAIYNHLNVKPYTDILTQQFDFALADNTPNWYFTDGGLRPSPTTYNFKQMDEVVNFAQSHNMPVQAHHFVWGEEKWLPEWLKNGNYTPEQLKQLMRDHIMTVGQRYRGKVTEWTVANETFSRQNNGLGLRDWWTDHIGDTSYLDDAFITARKADPNAVLILNDFNNEVENPVSDAMYTYIKDAKARGVPIDGLGMQMHIDGRHPPTKEAVIRNMQRFKEIGVKVYVTEFDVNMNDVKADGESKNHIQSDIYYEMMRACIESENCPSFAQLGITDNETWYNYLGLPDARPLMFDRQYDPKPAYWSFRDALQQD